MLCIGSDKLSPHPHQVLRGHEVEADAPLVIGALRLLTCDGARIDNIGANVGEMLINLLPQCVAQGGLPDALALVAGVVRHNFLILDSATARALLSCVCDTCSAPGTEEDVAGSLQVLDEVITLQSMPAACVPQVLVTLCRAACMAAFNGRAGQLVQHLANSNRHMGLLCYRGLVRLLQEHGVMDAERDALPPSRLGPPLGAAGGADAEASAAKRAGRAATVEATPPRDPRVRSAHILHSTLLRGAVNILSRCGWRDLPLTTVEVRPEVVLPLFRQLVRADMPGVCFEVITAAGHLMQRRLRLSATAWDAVFGVFRTAHSQTGLLEMGGPLQEAINDVAEWAESLCQSNNFYGDIDQLHAFLQRSGAATHVQLAMQYHAQAMRPDTPDWLGNVDRFLRVYYIDEDATVDVRLRALEAVTGLLAETCDVYADDLVLHGPIGQHLAVISPRIDTQLQVALLRLWTRMGLASSRLARHALDVLERWFDSFCLMQDAAEEGGSPISPPIRLVQEDSRDALTDAVAARDAAHRGKAPDRQDSKGKGLHAGALSEEEKEKEEEEDSDASPDAGDETLQGCYVRCLRTLLVQCIQQPSHTATLHALRLIIQAAEHALSHRASMAEALAGKRGGEGGEREREGKGGLATLACVLSPTTAASLSLFYISVSHHLRSAPPPLTTATQSAKAEMSVKESKVSASLTEALQLLAQLRWDALHRVFLEDAGVEPEASCLLLDVFAYTMPSDGSAAPEESQSVEHPSLSVVRGVFRALTKALATTLPFAAVRCVTAVGRDCARRNTCLLSPRIFFPSKVTPVHLVFPPTPCPLAVIATGTWRRALQTCWCSKAFLPAALSMSMP